MGESRAEAIHHFLQCVYVCVRVREKERGAQKQSFGASKRLRAQKRLICGEEERCQGMLRKTGEEDHAHTNAYKHIYPCTQTKEEYNCAPSAHALS